MAIFFITTNSRSKAGTPFQFPFECDCADVRELIDHLNLGKLVVGNKLFIRDSGDGEFAIESREPIGIGMLGVQVVQLYVHRVYEKSAPALLRAAI
jgi:hypothetical protein